MFNFLIQVFDQLQHPGMVFLVIASAITSFVSALAGFGGGVLLLAIMANIINPAHLIAVHGLVQLGSNASRVIAYWRAINFQFAKHFMIGAILGVISATFVVAQLPADTLLLIIALFILTSAWLPEKIQFKDDHLQVSTMGATLSFLSLFVGATGPLLASFLRSINYVKSTFVGTLALCILGQNLLKIAAFSAIGFNIGEWLPFVVLMIISGVFGTWAGAKMLGRLNEKHFRTMIQWVMTAIALKLIFDAVYR